MILFQQALMSIAEPLLNKALRYDHYAGKKIADLEGKSLSVVLTDISVSINVGVYNGVVRLSNNIDVFDCYVKTELSQLKKLADAAQITSMIKQDLLEIEGELRVAQQFSALFMDNDIDWEEWLSRYLGDALTHRLVSKSKKITNDSRRKLNDLEYTVHSALVDELKVVPANIEISQFSNHVDQVAARTEMALSNLNKIKAML